MSRGTAAQAEQPCTFEWTPGQITQAAAQFVIALGAALLRFEPAVLLPMLMKHGAKLVETLAGAITTFVAEVSQVLMPRFAAQLKGWRIEEDLGEAVEEDGSWVEEFFRGLKIDCVHQGTAEEGEQHLVGDKLVKRLRAKIGDRRQFDQYVLDWLIDHWDDPRIPGWFKKVVESGQVVIMATGTILLNPLGLRYVLRLFWCDGQPHWGFDWLSYGGFCRKYRCLVPVDS